MLITSKHHENSLQTQFVRYEKFHVQLSWRKTPKIASNFTLIFPFCFLFDDACAVHHTLVMFILNYKSIK